MRNLTPEERKSKIKNIINMLKELEEKREQVPDTQAADCVQECNEFNFDEYVRYKHQNCSEKN